MNVRTLFPLVLALAACDVESSDPSSLASEQAALPQPMTLTVAPQLVAGQPLQLQVTGAQPGANLLLVRSNGVIGAGGCPAPLNGGCLDITPGTSGYIVQANLTANAGGSVVFNPTLPTTLPTGARVTMQVVAVSAALGSNPVSQLVVDPNACVDDGFEPNDSPAQRTVNPATPLDAAVCEGNDDYFAFLVPPGQVVTVSAAFDHAGDGDVDLELYDANGGQLDVSAGTTDLEEVFYHNTGAGPVPVVAKVILFDDNGGLSGAEYTLSATTAPPAVCVEDAYEQNDSSTATTPLTAGVPVDVQTCAGDEDWFSYTSTGLGALVIDYSSLSADGSVALSILDSSLNVISSAVTFGNSTVQANVGAGQYYVRAAFVDEDDALAYPGVTGTIEASFSATTACPVESYEPNDTTATATVLPLGLTTGLGACGVGGVDWYSVTLAAGQTLSSTIYFTDADADVDLFLRTAPPTAETYSGYLSGALVSSTSATDNEAITFTSPAGGTYYLAVRVYADGGAPIVGGTIYDLEASVTP
jgi:hypothetical protein